MSSDALDIYDEQLDFILGSEGHTTEPGIYDPDGTAQTIYGVFDDHTFRGNKDAGNIKQKTDGPRFVVAESISFDIYTDKILKIRAIDYTIQYVDNDENGAQVIWLF